MRFVKVRLSPNKHHLLPGPLPARFLLSGSEVKSFSPVRLFATPWTVAPQAPPSMGFSRQEYWSVLPCPPPRNLPDPGIIPVSPASAALQANSLPTEPPGKPKNKNTDIEICCTPNKIGPHGLGPFGTHHLWSLLPINSG